ncbi:MAG: hypothetical protein M2R45_01928 [Verrucomicrobia subdivision 3 bacterium]|nr:hypothetical protein [Limisphaerales bacterium]
MTVDRVNVGELVFPAVQGDVTAVSVFLHRGDWKRGNKSELLHPAMRLIGMASAWLDSRGQDKSTLSAMSMPQAW